MKTLEIRRHTYRTKPGQHLSQQGVTVARRVGEGIGPFERVVTSTFPRAFETAFAMGFAVDEQVELMSSYSCDVELEVPWPLTPSRYAEAIRNGGVTAQYANQLADFYHRLVNDLAEGGAALVINHGGIAGLIGQPVGIVTAAANTVRADGRGHEPTQDTQCANPGPHLCNMPAHAHANSRRPMGQIAATHHAASAPLDASR